MEADYADPHLPPARSMQTEWKAACTEAISDLADERSYKETRVCTEMLCLQKPNAVALVCNGQNIYMEFLPSNRQAFSLR